MVKIPILSETVGPRFNNADPGSNNTGAQSNNAGSGSYNADSRSEKYRSTEVIKHIPGPNLLWKD